MLVNSDYKKPEILRLKALMVIAIADAKIKQRPNRIEPRCVKRRPKPYQLLNKPRGQMIETPHRGKKRVKVA